MFILLSLLRIQANMCQASEDQGKARGEQGGGHPPAEAVMEQARMQPGQEEINEQLGG